MQENTVVGQQQRVTLLDGSSVRYVNLDNAASTPALESVLHAVNKFMPMYSSVHRGSGVKSRYSTQMYEDAREYVLKFFGGNDKDHVVIFGMNTSTAINKLSHRLHLTKDDVVITSLLEHHSNDLPWRDKAKVIRVKLDSNGGIDGSDLEKLFVKHGKAIKIVAITGASNVTGYIPDIHKIARMTHAVGAEILVDGAQLAPHRPINMKRLGDDSHIDYLTVSAHKMYAPFGTGALITRRDRFQTGVPEYSGGGTINFVSLDEVLWADTPERDEVGSPNVVGAIAFAESLRFLSKKGMATIVAHEQILVQYAVDSLSKIKGITLFGATDKASLKNRTGVITFTIENVNHALATEILSAEHGVGVRGGCFCAHPYVIELLGINKDELKLLKSHKVAKEQQPIPGLIRVSFGLYNTKDDVDRVVKGLKSICNGNYDTDYKFDSATGNYEIKGWPALDSVYKD